MAELSDDAVQEFAFWDAYDSKDQDGRRARWTAVVVAWVFAHDDMVNKLLGPMELAELIDLDASLTSLRHEIRRIISDKRPPDQPK